MGMYLHFDGTQIGHADPAQPRSEQIDKWFPKKPDITTVEKVIEGSCAETEIFHKIYDFKAGITVGGIHIGHGSVGVDAHYEGKVEVWKDK